MEFITSAALVFLVLLLGALAVWKVLVAMVEENLRHDRQVGGLLRQLEEQQSRQVDHWLQANKLILNCREDRAAHIARETERLMAARAQMQKNAGQGGTAPVPPALEQLQDALERATARSAMPTPPRNVPQSRKNSAGT